jgi:GntR family transcriptional regulator, transcriptional repressor for pyruvate dehydrogenase complex
MAAGPVRSGRSEIQLAPMEVPKASDVLADALRERILSGEFQEGTPLPPERELVVQTRMSRTTVRESLRILEVQGLVRIKAGRAGGAFVQRPGEESMARSVGLLIRGRQIRLAALLETREAIEPFCARLAATQRTDDDLAVLERANADIGASIDSTDLGGFLQSNLDWHVGVASAGHNELLTGMMMALSEAIYTATANESFIDRTVKETTFRAHSSITKAIRERDPDAAVRRMTRHVHSHAEALMQVDERTDIDLPNRV